MLQNLWGEEESQGGSTFPFCPPPAPLCAGPARLSSLGLVLALASWSRRVNLVNNVCRRSNSPVEARTIYLNNNSSQPKEFVWRFIIGWILSKLVCYNLFHIIVFLSLLTWRLSSISLQPIPYQKMEHDRVTSTRNRPIRIPLISEAPPSLHPITMVTTSKPKVLGSWRITSESLCSYHRDSSTNKPRFMPAAEWTERSALQYGIMGKRPQWSCEHNLSHLFSQGHNVTSNQIYWFMMEHWKTSDRHNYTHKTLWYQVCGLWLDWHMLGMFLVSCLPLFFICTTSYFHCCSLSPIIQVHTLFSFVQSFFHVFLVRPLSLFRQRYTDSGSAWRELLGHPGLYIV